MTLTHWIMAFLGAKKAPMVQECGWDRPHLDVVPLSLSTSCSCVAWTQSLIPRLLSFLQVKLGVLINPSSPKRVL